MGKHTLGPWTTVFNASTGAEHSYTLPPRKAVLAAFAISTMGDANSWGWEKRFGHLVKKTVHGWVVGDWFAVEIDEQHDVTNGDHVASCVRCAKAEGGGR